MWLTESGDTDILYVFVQVVCACVCTCFWVLEWNGDERLVNAQ